MQLKVICTLRHQEIGNLFGVCKELRATVRLLQGSSVQQPDELYNIRN